MKAKITRLLSQILSMSVAGVLSWTVYAQGETPDFLLKYESQGVPSQSRVTTFDGSSGIPLPMETKPAKSTVVVKPQPLSEKEKQSFAAALGVVRSSSQLKAELGSDSLLLSGGELPRPRDAGDGYAPQYKFTFYNYQKDQAVEALVSAGRVVQVRERELGYQPAVSSQELKIAARIAGKQFAEIGEANPDLLRGLAESGPDGRRQIRLFADLPIRATAVVDLHNQKVLEVQ